MTLTHTPKESRKEAKSLKFNKISVVNFVVDFSYAEQISGDHSTTLPWAAYQHV